MSRRLPRSGVIPGTLQDKDVGRPANVRLPEQSQRQLLARLSLTTASKPAAARASSVEA